MNRYVSMNCNMLLYIDLDRVRVRGERGGGGERGEGGRGWGRVSGRMRGRR